jgi:hypothetical protein
MRRDPAILRASSRHGSSSPRPRRPPPNQSGCLRAALERARPRWTLCPHRRQAAISHGRRPGSWRLRAVPRLPGMVVRGDLRWAFPQAPAVARSLTSRGGSVSLARRSAPRATCRSSRLTSRAKSRRTCLVCVSIASVMTTLPRFARTPLAVFAAESLAIKRKSVPGRGSCLPTALGAAGLEVANLRRRPLGAHRHHLLPRRGHALRRRPLLQGRVRRSLLTTRLGVRRAGRAVTQGFPLSAAHRVSLPQRPSRILLSSRLAHRAGGRWSTSVLFIALMKSMQRNAPSTWRWPRS